MTQNLSNLKLNKKNQGNQGIVIYFKNFLPRKCMCRRSHIGGSCKAKPVLFHTVIYRTCFDGKVLCLKHSVLVVLRDYTLITFGTLFYIG